MLSTSSSSLPLNQLTSRIGHSGIFHKDQVYLFGGFVNSNTLDKPLVYVNDLIQVDVSTRKWVNKTTHNIGPSARNFHSSCLLKGKENDDRSGDGADEMIIFGGKSNGFHNDVWSYRFDTSEWRLLEPSSGVSGVSGGNQMISPRYGQSATIYGDYLVVFGGYDNNSFTSNELFIFNLESREWKLIELSVEIKGRYYHASVLDEETGDWYILGGKSATNLVKDFVKIKLSTLDVDKATCQSEVLISELDGFAPRFGHSLVLEKSENGKRLYSIGGCNNKVDHLDCIYIDLNNIKNGWDVTYTHSLSHTFKSKDVGPVFHANVPFQVINEDDSIAMNYFVFGGTYQKTEDSKIQETSQQTDKIEKKQKKKQAGEPSFNIEVFDNVMNDDIFRLVLSFMTISDLCKLELVSKKLRICKLTSEDQYWKDYYYQRINLYLEASKTYNYNYNKITRAYETNYQYSEIYTSYLKFTSNYKRRLIEVIGECMSKADRDHHKRTSYIEGLSQCGSDIYVPKEEILKYKLKNASTSAFKIVQVGDGAVGKTCLWISLTTNAFPHEYVPTVFDNYSQNYVCDGTTFSLGLWDTAGPEDYDRLRPLSYPQTDLFFLSFSCSSESSMDNVVSKWIPEIRHHCPTTAVALVCTKIDFRDDPVLSRELLVKKHKKIHSFEQGELLAKKMGCLTYLETSALTGAGIKDLNEVMVRSISMWNDPSFKQIVKKNREKKNCNMQ